MNEGASAGAVAGRVRRLPDALIDQIAAGEVVERPASVVKELVENALDAEAGRVRVEIRDGGRNWIAITDDGIGMTPADARLALERHATSKLATADDLQRIGTFGFRGEALPAIASVSTLRLRTRARGAREGCEIRVQAGAVTEARASGGPTGTRIEVADLFAGLPARRKFLKSAQTEWGHIADWLSRSALALPNVHFDIQRDARAALVWPAVRDPLDRISMVLGEREAESLEVVEFEEGRASVRGFVSRPDRHRATQAGVYLFVNRRPVRDRVLQHALVDVYRDWLPRGRFPSAVLFVDVPLEAVDVNVHPAKWEVRFADPRWAHRLLRSAVASAMARRAWIGAADTPGDATAQPREPGGPTTRLAPRAGAAAARGGGAGDWLFATPADAEPPQARGAAAAVRFGDLRPLGQLAATYLLVEAKDRLLLVDQHAAHERVLYEGLRAEWLSRGVQRQGLLAPLALAVEPRAIAALDAGAETLERLGFEVERFGEETIAVRAIPALLAGRDPAALVRGLLDEWDLRDASGASAVRALPEADRLFATLACHAARRKGDALDAQEQRALLDALDAIPWAPTCPHGRPVCVPFEISEIERRFGRR
jgi:DNA mismatch repair protein MutL